MSDDFFPILQHLRIQAGICRQFGPAFSADLLEQIAADTERGGPFVRLVTPWLGDTVRHLFAEAVALRILGALHYLALTGADAELAAVYPAPNRERSEAGLGDLLSRALLRYPMLFDEFMVSPPQTNEARRSLCLVGGFLTVAARTGMPLRCLEIGASAGLNMNWDRYHYDFGAGRAWGDSDSPVRLVSEWSGGAPPLPESLSVIEKRACDQNPIDISDDASALRLQAYVWPDQWDRLARLKAAIDLARRSALRIDKADAADWVRTHAEPRAGVATVLYHSVVWSYLPKPTANAIAEQICVAGESASAAAPFAWLRMEPDPGDSGETMMVRLTIWPSGEEMLLAQVHPHGAKVSWLAQ